MEHSQPSLKVEQYHYSQQKRRNNSSAFAESCDSPSPAIAGSYATSSSCAKGFSGTRFGASEGLARKGFSVVVLKLGGITSLEGGMRR